MEIITFSGSHNLGKTTLVKWLNQYSNVKIFDEKIREYSRCEQYSFVPYATELRMIKYRDEEGNIEEIPKRVTLKDKNGLPYYTLKSLKLYADSEDKLVDDYSLELKRMIKRVLLYGDSGIDIFGFDRLLFDPPPYCKYFYYEAEKFGVPKKYLDIFKRTYQKTLNALLEHHLNGDFDNLHLYILKPIPIVDDDGFRLGEEAQEKVHQYILEMLNILMINYKLMTADECKQHIINNFNLKKEV